MSTDEAQQLSQIAARLLMHFTADGTAGTTLWAFHVTISLAALSCLLRRGIKTTASRILLFAVVILLLEMTATTFISIGQIVLALRGLMNNPEVSLEERWTKVVRINELLQLPSACLNGDGGLMFLVGDAVALWRAWAICWHRRRILLLPAAFFVLALAFSISAGVVWSNPHSDNILALWLGITSGILSIATNAVASAMIGYQAYEHRQLVRAGHLAYRDSQPYRILSYVMETGIVYCITQIIFLVLAYLQAYESPLSPIDYAFRIWQGITLFISVSSPSVIILLVAYNRAFYPSDPRGMQTLDTHLSFSGRQNRHGGNSSDIETSIAENEVELGRVSKRG